MSPRVGQNLPVVRKILQRLFIFPSYKLPLYLIHCINVTISKSTLSLVCWWLKIMLLFTNSNERVWWRHDVFLGCDTFGFNQLYKYITIYYYYRNINKGTPLDCSDNKCIVLHVMNQNKIFNVTWEYSGPSRLDFYCRIPVLNSYYLARVLWLCRLRQYITKNQLLY